MREIPPQRAPPAERKSLISEMLLRSVTKTLEGRRAVARILIVDDEETDLLLMQAILARAGHETLVAEGGEEALRGYLGSGIDVVVTDLQMPDVHGFELISILREFSPAPEIIAVSATGPFQLHMAEALGARWTLTKPLDPDLLLDAVDRAITAIRERDEGVSSG